MDNSCQPKRVLPIHLQVGSIFHSLGYCFVIEAVFTYNMLQGRDWIDANYCIPSLELLVLWNLDTKDDGNELEIVIANNKLYLVNANMTEPRLYDLDWRGPLKNL